MTTPKPPRAYQVIGTSPARPDAVDKVTGRALFGADVRLPGMLYGAVLRSPHAHARIRSIDTRAAEQLPGVHAVVTAADLPPESGLSFETCCQRDNILASHKVLYFGHAVAAVAANSLHAAREALESIHVEYEVLPAVLDVRQAMQADAPILLENLRMESFGDEYGRPGNIAMHIRHKLGDPAQGFARADFVVERQFCTSPVHQGYIEPQNATAVWSANAELAVWCSTQGSFGARDQLAAILQVPVSKIRVTPMEIGGGFGGKNEVYLEPVAALLSRKAGGRPVKLAMSRAEVLAATGPTSGSFIRVKIGADRSGKITAAEASLAYEAGAFPGSPLWSCLSVILGAYAIENVQIDGYDVVVNKPHSATYRAPGGTNAVFAAETAIDELAEKLGIDPLEFRRINAAREGVRKADGPVFGKIGFLETLEAARSSAHYQSPLDGPNRGRGSLHHGRGVASAYWGNGGGKSSASASLNPDGSINLVEGSVDLASGRIVIAMQLAETLGIPVEAIRTHVGDTDSVGYTEGTYGSRTTVSTGWAVYQLGQDLIQEMLRRAAAYWKVDPQQVQYAHGCLTCGDRHLTLQDLGTRMDEFGGPISVSISTSVDQWAPSFATHIVDVEVDSETGKVQLLRYTAVQEVGTAVHPASLAGQIQGGAAQGIGWALNEEYVYDEQGHLLNATFLDYRIPTALDLPAIDTILVEVPNPTHPFGVRGAGEIPILPPPAAIANAIYAAVGVRLDTLPMNPGRVLAAIKAKEVNR
jgi:xanthine dehydrogenase molybdenum-binding subunit